MRSMQTKVLAAIEATTKVYHHEMICNSEWANTGRIRIEKTDGWEPVVSFTYDFQSSYFTLRGYVGDIPERERDTAISARQPEDMPRVLSWLAEQLRQPRQQKVTAFLCKEETFKPV